MIDLRSGLKPKMTLDLTPLVDVLFILLIFFILSYNELNVRGHKIHLPEDQKGEMLRLQAKGPITITVYKNGKVYVDSLEVAISEIPGKLKELIKKREKSPDILINAEGKVELQTMVSIFDAIKLAGIRKPPYLRTKKKKN